MSRVVKLTREDLEHRREAILSRLGVSLAELADRAERGALVGDEWDAWDDLQDIAFLLGDG